MKCADTKPRVSIADYGRICCSESAACSPSRRDAKRKCDVAFASDAALMTTNGLPVMVVGGPTAISAEPVVSTRTASCASPCCWCWCCPDLQVWSRTTLSGGGMWSAQLRSSPPPPHAAASQTGTAHGCAALADKQAVILVAFPICASSADSQESNQLHPASTPTASASCRCCCKCSWSVKSAPSWTSPQDPGKTSFPLNEEERKPTFRWAGAASDVDTDLSRVRDALRTLRTSGYYYEGLSWEEAGRLLRGQPSGHVPGARQFGQSVPVRAERSDRTRSHQRPHPLLARTVPAGLRGRPSGQHAVVLVRRFASGALRSDSAGLPKGQMCVWLDGHGRRDLPIVLTRPLYRQPASLQHLCRIALNRSAASVAAATSSTSCRTVEPLPAALKDYLRDYPHLH
ncbi:hypothetical protein MRX96_022156 [Rhipicephalus microplus]